MSATKIDTFHTTMEEIKKCGTCWHFVTFMGSTIHGWCDSPNSEKEECDVNKSTPACTCWNLKPLFDFWG
jgi:hypothetical protein